MIPSLSVAYFTCVESAETFSSKFVEFHTTWLGQRDGRTWSPVYSGDGEFAAKLQSYTYTASIMATSTPTLNGLGTLEGSSYSLAAVIGGAVGGVLFIAIVVGMVYFYRRSRRVRDLHHHEDKDVVNQRITYYTPVNNRESRMDHDEHPSPIIVTGDLALRKVHTLTESTLMDELSSGTGDSAPVQPLTARRNIVNWPTSPKPIRVSKWTMLARWSSDLAIIFMAIVFLAYAFVVRAYDGVQNDDPVARTLLRIAKFVGVSIEFICSY